jgi:type VI secretion system protein ImpG
MLPYSARSFPGYRLLTEYFTFPQKFLFFDIDLASAKAKSKLRTTGNQLEIFLFLSRTDRDLERILSAETFRLGCTPIVNLYAHQTEPLKLTQTEFEYRVRPDNRRPLAHEIYTIERVTASGPNGQQIEYRPFFSMRHATPSRQPPAFWYATRRPAEPSAKDAREPDRGTEVFISLVDLAQKVSAPIGWTLGIETVCLNRDLPVRLPFRAGHTQLQMSGDSEVVARALCLTRPTPTLRPGLRQGALWRLISHLSLNYLSLGAEGDQGDALREILKLYDFKDSAETHKIITSILNVSSRPVVGRIAHPVGGTFFSRGVEMAIHFEATGGTFLFAVVLERFLALYCTINSFSKLVATVKDRDGVLREWPPRVGEKILV